MAYYSMREGYCAFEMRFFVENRSLISTRFPKLLGCYNFSNAVTYYISGKIFVGIDQNCANGFEYKMILINLINTLTTII